MKRSEYDHMTDAQLLEQYYRTKEPHGMGILLPRYTLLLFGVCLKYLKNEEEAKDAVQQVFLKVLHEAGKYRIDYFKSWLYMVAKNYCLMKLRSRQGLPATTLTEDTMAHLTEENQGEKEEKEQTYEQLEAAIGSLSKEQRESVILFYLHKNSYSQISEKTGYSLMQVKSYIQNGKRNLKQLLEKKSNTVNGNHHEGKL